MKKLFALLFLLQSVSGFAQRNIDVLHYRFHIAVNDNNDTIHGVAIIKFIAQEKKTSLELDLTGIKKGGKGMLATVVGFRNSTPATEQFKQQDDKLIVPCRLNKGDTAELVINYKGIPADGLIISKNKYGHRTFFSDNWPNRAHNWIPCNDDPADKATVEFMVVAPSHYQVISNGLQIEESTVDNNNKETHWKEEVPLPTKVMVIGVADFAVNHVGNVDCIPVSSWVFPENRTEGFYDYAQAKEILSWYINYIGPYAYKKLANVQSKTIFGGMENASAIFYFENSVTGKRQEEALIAHELVHQWFGNHATEKSFAHLWLSEGFATYLTHIFIESKYGTDSLNKRMQKEREEIIEFVNAAKRPVVDSTSDYMSLLNTNSYQKGGWVLHMLRRELGDSIFKKAVRKYYETYAGKNAESTDLQTIFETVSGKNLGQFFKQWLLVGENPKLEISWKYVEKSKQLSVTVKQLQKTVFHFPIDIAIGISGSTSKPQIKNLKVTKAIETFTIPVDRKSHLLPSGLDPLTSLLYQGTLLEEK